MQAIFGGCVDELITQKDEAPSPGRGLLVKKLTCTIETSPSLVAVQANQAGHSKM